MPSSLFVWTVRNTVLRQLQLKRSPEGSETSQRYELLYASFPFFTALIVFIFYLILSFLTITSADARYRHRRQHARPEIHRDVRNPSFVIRSNRFCNLPSWDEIHPETIPYPNATGSSVVDLGRTTKW